MDKKGQLKIQQMAFMMVAVTLFIILAGLFYLAIYTQHLAQSALELKERKAIVNAELFSQTPEVSCGSGCIDTDKLMALQRRKEYQGFWPYASIEFRKIYPREGLSTLCSIKNYPNCTVFTLIDKKFDCVQKVSNFVALCRREGNSGEIARRCELGKVVLGLEVNNAGCK